MSLATAPGRRRSTVASRLVCAGCGWTASDARPFRFDCPAARSDDDIDHVLQRVLDTARIDPHPAPHPNPFVRYRTRFHSYQAALGAGWSDQRYVDLVGELDDAVARVDGHGFRTTPVVRSGSLDTKLGFSDAGGIWIKDETGNVSGSHKARHLMGLMLNLRVAETMGLSDAKAPLAIASCGNAALAAAVVARAAERRLLVFVPPSAEDSVIERLGDLGAEIEVCERRPGQAGDPTYQRLLHAIADRAAPFTVQGNLAGLAIEGGATLTWELIDQLPDATPTLDRIIIQVGGGALATAQAMALREAQSMGLLAGRPRFDTVQTAGGYPLARAHDLVRQALGVAPGEPVDVDHRGHELREISWHRSDYMWPWETEPVSIAHGILDDETYDWLAVSEAMLASGGRCVVVDEATLEQANAYARPVLGIDADHTGTAGLAGLIQLTRDGVVDADETVAVIFSGATRRAAAASPPSPGGETLP